MTILLLIMVVLSLRKGVKTFTANLKPVDVEVLDLDALEAGDDEDGDGENDDASDEDGEDGDSEDEAESDEDGEMKSLEAGPRSADDVMRIIDSQPIEVAALLRSWADEGVRN